MISQNINVIAVWETKITAVPAPSYKPFYRCRAVAAVVFFFVLYQYFLLYPGKPGLDARGETWPTATGSPCCGSSRFCYIKP